MVVTGESTSRLSEIKKYTTTGDIFNQHLSSTGSDKNGVNKNQSDLSSTPQKIVYYVDGITYVDLINGNDVSTTFSFKAQGTDSPDFLSKKIIKDPNKQNIVQKPKIDNDVFIERQQLSVFDKNFRLREIRNLVELSTYAGGRYFNIVNNS